MPLLQPSDLLAKSLPLIYMASYPLQIDDNRLIPGPKLLIQRSSHMDDHVSITTVITDLSLADIYFDHSFSHWNLYEEHVGGYVIMDH